VLLIGCGLGYLFTTGVFTEPANPMLASILLGLAWAILLLQWLDLLVQNLGFSSQLLPASLNLADREAVQEHVSKLSPSRQLSARTRNLLASWSKGATPQQVIELAAFQSRKALQPVRAATIFAVVLVIASIYASHLSVAAWAAVVVLALTVYSRLNLLNRIDSYLEENLLSRLPATLGNSSLTANDLGNNLAHAVQDAFKQHVPQPEKMAEAIRGAVTEVSKKTSEVVTQLQDVLGKLTSQTQEKTSTWAADVQKALASHASQVGGVGTTWSQQVATVLSQHSDKLQETNQQIADILSQHVTLLQQANQQMASLLSDHGKSLKSVNADLGAKLDKIATLQSEVDKVLHVQEMVDGAIRGVTASQEFAGLLQSIRAHLSESDKVLREISRPRKIRLVEAHPEMAQRKS